MSQKAQCTRPADSKHRPIVGAGLGLHRTFAKFPHPIDRKPLLECRLSLEDMALETARAAPKSGAIFSELKRHVLAVCEQPLEVPMSPTAENRVGLR